MAWHIIHGLLEQVRVHSTFPGKLWIVMMFVFRIAVVARIGDSVYHDEQESFVCNTLTPGCENVCFNKFSPISQLRFWSLLVLTVATPGILFFIYAGHKIYHAYVKFPLNDDSDQDKSKSFRTSTSDFGSVPPYRPPSSKRKRTDANYPFANATAPQLYVVKRLNSKNTDRLLDKNKHPNGVRNRRFAPKINNEEEKDLLEKGKGSTTDNNYTSFEDIRLPRRWQYFTSDHVPNKMSYPIYADSRGKKVEYIKNEKPFDEIKARKETRRMLENPQLYRAYWWHVVFRTLFEAGFLCGQFYLYGFFVPELFECTRSPCPKTVDCYVSRPMEKTCLAFLMFGLGGISCLLSIGEFWSLGWNRFVYAVCCRGHKMSYEEKRRRLAKLAKENQQHDEAKSYQKPLKDEIFMVHHSGHYKSAISLDSLSSDTTVESV